MDSIEAAILRTVLYADIFQFPMTAEEIHHFLIHDRPVSLEVIRQTLAASTTLRQLVDYNGDYVVYDGHHDSAQVRRARQASSAHLWPLALRSGIWLARLPFVRMVALTGALAVRNAAADDDDLDYLLVTEPGRVWLARAFAIVLVRLGRLRGVEICPNYVLSASALLQNRRDIFIAHEVVQMVPFYGLALYAQLRGVNAWVDAYLPNACEPFYREAEQELGAFWKALKRAAEWALSGRLGDRLEGWEYQRKLRRFAGDMRTPHSSARLDEQQVKGHFNDHGNPVLHQYEERLRQHGLLNVVELAASAD
jgi:hypothetical protein